MNKNFDKKVSVIIPVYNVEKTLHKSINSIINQTLKEIEIILVNDGSNDGSGAICDSYVSRYKNIQVIHKKNEGLGPTRNAGTTLAKGEYIYHCDSDDWVEPTMLEDVYLNAKRNNADAVIFGYKILTEKNGLLQEYGIISSEDRVYNNKSEVQNFFISNINNSYIAQSACNRIIKREFLEKHKIQFKPFRRCQDTIFSLDLFDYLESLNVISRHYYNYVIEPGKFKSRSFHEAIKIYLNVYDELIKHLTKWKKFVKSDEQLLSYMYIGHISNYASFYIITKSKNTKLSIIRDLIQDKRVQKLFSRTKIRNIKSQFLILTSFAIKCKNPYLLLIIFLFHEAKVKFNIKWSNVI